MNGIVNTLLASLEGLESALFDMITSLLSLLLSPLLSGLGASSSLPGSLLSFLHSCGVIVDTFIPSASFHNGLLALFNAYMSYLAIRMIGLPMRIASKLVGAAASAVGGLAGWVVKIASFFVP